jgi:hypothetical protein
LSPSRPSPKMARECAFLPKAGTLTRLSHELRRAGRTAPHRFIGCAGPASWSPMASGSCRWNDGQSTYVFKVSIEDGTAVRPAGTAFYNPGRSLQTSAAPVQGLGRPLGGSLASVGRRRPWPRREAQSIWDPSATRFIHNIVGCSRITIADNRVAAGTWVDGTLTIRLEARTGQWYSDRDTDPGVVKAFTIEVDPCRFPVRSFASPRVPNSLCS